MRVDLFLKISRLIKRRTIAREMCENGRVLINRREASPGKEVKPGDVITLKFRSRIIEIEVMNAEPAPAGKHRPEELYRVKSDQRVQDEADSWIKNLS